MSSLNADMELLYTPIPNPDRSVLAYPFSFITGAAPTKYANNWGIYYDMVDHSEGLLGEEKCDSGKFPNNIVEFYWIREGENDDEPWQLLCKLDNGNYAYYTAWCDYTGFDCQGGMKLIVSKDLKRLFYEGLTEGQRHQCLTDKSGGP